jgi:hypothetical protein
MAKGRRPTPTGRIDRKINIYLNDEEYDLLQQKMEEGGFYVYADFFRQILDLPMVEPEGREKE